MPNLRRLLSGIALALLIAAASASKARAQSIEPVPVVDVPKASPLPQTASQSPRPELLGIFAGANLLTIPNGYGSSLGLGLRVRPIKRLALGFDVGYGLLAVSSTIQDRWWAMPSVSLVVPLRYVQLDFGAGFGVGTTSGYTSWPAYLAAPFTPIWHFTVPAVRVHAIASFPVSRRVDLFARLDFASLLFTGPKSAYTGLADTTWFALWFGFQYWVR